MLNSYDEGWPRASHMPAVRSRHQCCAAQAFNGSSARRYGLCSRLSNTAQMFRQNEGSQCKRNCNRTSFAHASTSPYSHSVHRRPQTLIADITVSNKEYDCSSDVLTTGLISLPTSCCSARITRESKTPPTRQHRRPRRRT